MITTAPTWESEASRLGLRPEDLQLLAVVALTMFLTRDVRPERLAEARVVRRWRKKYYFQRLERSRRGA